MICTIWFLTVLTIGNIQQKIFHDVDSYLFNSNMDAVIIQQTVRNPKNPKYDKIVSRTMLSGVMKVKCVKTYATKERKKNKSRGIKSRPYHKLWAPNGRKS